VEEIKFRFNKVEEAILRKLIKEEEKERRKKKKK
jgi:hypothetical protein